MRIRLRWKLQADRKRVQARSIAKLDHDRSPAFRISDILTNLNSGMIL